MFSNSKKAKQKDKQKEKAVQRQTEKLNEPLKNMSLATDLEQNITLIKDLFKDDDTFVVREFKNRQNDSMKFCLMFSDGVVSSEIINEFIIRPLMMAKMDESSDCPMDVIKDQMIMINQVIETGDVFEIVKAVTYGNTVLLINGTDKVLLLETKNIKTRSFEEPASEQIISGPREGFAEALLSNLSLVRRRIRSHQLKMRYFTMGQRTNTNLCICYIDDIVDKSILDELYRRLDGIDIDGVLDGNYLTELIKDHRWSPFRTTGYTERPDVVVAKLLEGRIAIFMDGTPVVITIPYLFIENFQSNEDYYLNFYYAAFTRFLRIAGFFLTVSIPALYVAIVAFHPEMLPTQLLISIAAERRSVPLPAALECFLLLIVFDLLRETGLRMPSNVGQALSIVGALVIGQAAVEAKLVAAPMIIVVALTAITSLLVIKMNAPMIYCRLFALFMSTMFGMFGYTIAMSIIVIHVINLTSFGIPQMEKYDQMDIFHLQDSIWRLPWWKMVERPTSIAKNKVRMKRHMGRNSY